MPVGRPPIPVQLSEGEKEELQCMTRSLKLPHGFVRRAQVILACAEGESHVEIGKRVGVSNVTVGKWRRRFHHQGIEGLQEGQRPGRARTHDDEGVGEVINTALQGPPANATHWSVRTLADHTGISKSTVYRWLQLFNLQPHRQRHFKISNDPRFVDKVQDIVDLYLRPPDHDVVLCVDEKTQIQALERTQPMLPLGLGYVEGVTHDYIRNGTTTLFAALDIGTGKVLAQCKGRHRHQEFLSFLQHVDRSVPKNLDIHLIIDNYCTHNYAKMKEWLARQPRFHLHFTPTYASWINQVERWFGIIIQKAIRRGSFHNVGALTRKINDFVEQYNTQARPFVWVATAESILAKIQRLCKAISRTIH